MKAVLGLIILILASLLSAASAMDERSKVVEDLRHELIELPPSAPERNGLKILGSLIFVEACGGASNLIYYDDIRTKWDIDYIEVYDIEGRLLVVSWVNRFGVCQVAMDRGLFDADNPKVEGVLVMITLGVTL